MRRSMTRMRNISRNKRHKRPISSACAEEAALSREETGGWAVISLHLQFPHSFYVGVKRIVKRVGYFAGAIGVGDAADGILDGKARLEAQDAFNLVRIDMVGTVVVGGGVFQLDGWVAQRFAHHLGDVFHRAVLEADVERFAVNFCGRRLE